MSESGKCNECTHSLTYLHSVGAVGDELFNTIIAGHKNKQTYDWISKLHSSELMYQSLKKIPSYVAVSFRLQV